MLTPEQKAALMKDPIFLQQAGLKPKQVTPTAKTDGGVSGSQKLLNYGVQAPSQPSVSVHRTTVAPKEDPSFLEKVGKGVEGFVGETVKSAKERAKNIGVGISELKKGKGVTTTPAEEALNIAGQTIGFGGDVIFNALKQVLPTGVKETAKKAVGKVMGTGIAQDTTSIISDWAAKNPRAARNLMNSIEVASVIPAAKGAELGVQATKAVGKSVAKNVSTGAIKEVKNLGKEILQETGKKAKQIVKGKDVGQATKLEEYISPRLSGAIKTQTSKEGRLLDPTFLKREKLISNEAIKRQGKLAEEVGINTKKGFKNNIDLTNKTIKDEAIQLKKIARETNAIVNKNNIKGKFNQAKKEAAEILDDNQLKQYDKYVAKYIRIMENNPNKFADSLLENRQSFDKWLKSNKPKVFNDPDAAYYQAVKSIRNTSNQYADEIVGNDIVKNSLRKQTDLYDIADNLANKQSKGATKYKSSGLKSLRKKYKQELTIGAGVVGGGGVMAAINK
jgi:hypothetical protein